MKNNHIISWGLGIGDWGFGVWGCGAATKNPSQTPTKTNTKK